LTDPLKTQWESAHVLGRWYDRKTKNLESYLNDIVVAMLTGAAIVRHDRIAAETAKRQRQEAHEAYLREQERLRNEARLDAFIESKADELARLQKIISFRDYLSRQHADTKSREQDPVLRAIDDLIRRLQRSLSADTLGRAFEPSKRLRLEDLNSLLSEPSFMAPSYNLFYDSRWH
jgi:hypothetical protein